MVAGPGGIERNIKIAHSGHLGHVFTEVTHRVSASVRAFDSVSCIRIFNPGVRQPSWQPLQYSILLGTC